MSEAWHAEIGDIALGNYEVHRFELLLGSGEGGLDGGDFAEPALPLGLLEPVCQIRAYRL